MITYNTVGIQSPEILLPSKKINYAQWAVVACDQYTSQPDYWEKVESIVGESPSTFWMILPEAYLGKAKEQAHQSQINAHMQEYLDQGILAPVNGFIYTERTIGTSKRRGLIAALDLEEYSFKKGTKSLIRATEGTIIERLPPRIKIREKALLEIPHILVLIDDPGKTIIEPLAKAKTQMTELYDFDLMQNGGHIEGHLVSEISIEQQIIAALEKLISPESFADKYNLSPDESPFLFAVGDGNHSLATAKSVWNEMKANGEDNHPARFALVEIVNIHDESLVFEPIHRLVDGKLENPLSAIKEYFNDATAIEKMVDFNSMKSVINNLKENEQKFGFFSADGFWVISLAKPEHSLTVGNVQNFLDDYLPRQNSAGIDYVHGDEAILKLGTQPTHAGFYLPAMQKSQLFRTVIKDGELPRKTFSMGEANEKRFYLECRKIRR